MNIFPLDTDLKKAAEYHFDSHVNKIILEIAQMLSTAFQGLSIEGVYKPTHKNHPMSIWVRKSKQNFKYMADMAEALNNEKKHRFGSGDHKSIFVVRKCLEMCNILDFELDELTQIPQCMPDDFKCDNTIHAYRKYYIGGKSHLAKWTNREIPDWYKL
jgi:Ulp1 family protease